MLHIYELRVDDLSLIDSLKDIEVLALEWNTKAQSLWDLTKNTSLKSLSITDFSKLNDIPLTKKQYLGIVTIVRRDMEFTKLKYSSTFKVS